MEIYDMPQGSDEWKQIKAGKFSASKFSKLFMKKSTKGYEGYINQIAIERLTGTPIPSYKSSWMQRGNDLEPEARTAYEFWTFNKVHEVGFVELDEWVGVSPDGLVGDKGCIEIKCLGADAFSEVKLTGKIENDYLVQMQGVLWVCEREWCDFTVYYPGLSLYINRQFRDEPLIKKLKAEIEIAKELVEKRMVLLK